MKYIADSMIIKKINKTKLKFGFVADAIQFTNYLFIFTFYYTFY